MAINGQNGQNGHIKDCNEEDNIVFDNASINSNSNTIDIIVNNSHNDDIGSTMSCV